MSALPINPTRAELRRFAMNAAELGVPADEAIFQAGVEAERARATAETTEEWGVVLDDLGSTDTYPTREEAELHLLGEGDYLIRITTERVQP